MAITKITGASIAADSIDGTKIADDAINSEHITDGGVDNVHIGDLAATKLTGTIASGRLSAANLGSGTVPTARLGSGTANNSVFLRGDNTWATAGSTSASDLTSGTLPMARLSGTLPALNGSALTNLPSDVTVASSAPSVGAAGELYYNTTNGALYVSNGTAWGLVSNATPTTTGGTVTIAAIEGGSASFSYNLGTDFTDAENTDAQLTYTLESGTMPTGCTLPSAGNSSFTGSSSYVSSNTNYTWVIRATDTDNAYVTQSYQQTINTLATFTNLQTTSMPHSGINVQEAGVRTETGSFTGATDNGAADHGVGFGWHDGHEGSPADWPAYIAIYVGTAKAVNQLKICVHGNSFGNFEFQGSNNANTSGTFYNTGSWTALTFTSTGSSRTAQNAGGNSSGLSERSVLTFNYTNNTTYTHFRLWIKDNSQQGSSGAASGWATYGWALNRA